LTFELKFDTIPRLKDCSLRLKMHPKYLEVPEQTIVRVEIILFLI